MNQTGLYEQLITQLVEQNLNRKTFHVGERLLAYAIKVICLISIRLTKYKQL
jgi:hypothetical protein